MSLSNVQWLRYNPNFYLILAACLSILVFFATSYLEAEPSETANGRYPRMQTPGASDSARLEINKQALRGVPDEAIPWWLKKPLPLAPLVLENTVHFDLDTELGIHEWNATLPKPRHDGIFWLPVAQDGKETRKPYTISLFHQLKCLNIIRESIVAFRSGQQEGAGRLTVHCMNYLRQMVLCRSDLTLESARHHLGPHIAVSDITHTCRDWSTFWQNLEKDWETYLS